MLDSQPVDVLAACDDIWSLNPPLYRPLMLFMFGTSLNADVSLVSLTRSRHCIPRWNAAHSDALINVRYV